jgi:hypothetical protein
MVSSEFGKKMVATNARKLPGTRIQRFLVRAPHPRAASLMTVMQVCNRGLQGINEKAVPIVAPGYAARLPKYEPKSFCSCPSVSSEKRTA